MLHQNCSIRLYKRKEYKLIIIMKEMNQQQKTNKNQTIRFEEKKRMEYLKAFLQKNQGQLIKELTLDKVKATILPDTSEHLELAGSMIRNGQLVGFPTETVYGLGADATNENALLDIYRVKRRPLTDPIIVHVLDSSSALKLVEPQSQKQLELFAKLTQKYWPGPLTVILKANLSILPKVVTAQTGFVGIRSPKGKYARLLIESSERPIGAPSANLFSHVSPTSAVHVLNDFYDQDITIVDGERCEYGVESTVVKIVDGSVEVLREGSLSTKKLTEFLEKEVKGVTITVKKRVHKEEQNKNMEAPGQLLKHYAPYLPCFSVNLKQLKDSHQKAIVDHSRNSKISLDEAALISFSSDFDTFKGKFKYYLSADQLDQREIQEENLEEDQKFCTLEQKKKMRSLYHMLRKAQNLDVKIILIGWNQDKVATLWDKIFRATQGHIAQLL